jgi:hypothetical protein
MFHYVDAADRERILTEPIDPLYFDTVLKKSLVTSIHVGVPWPIKHLPYATLTAMELDILFFADPTDFNELRAVLPNVHTVVVIINFAVFCGRILAYHTPRQRAHVGLKLFLHYIVPKVKHFCIEMPRAKLEYSQTAKTHDHHGGLLPAFIIMKDDMQDIEDMPLNSTHDLTAWDWLLKALDPVNTTLTSLTLTQNSYSSAGHMIKSMPSLPGFMNLETLSLPPFALVSNPNSINSCSPIYKLVKI